MKVIGFIFLSLVGFLTLFELFIRVSKLHIGDAESTVVYLWMVLISSAVGISARIWSSNERD